MDSELVRWPLVSRNVDKEEEEDDDDYDDDNKDDDGLL